MQFTTLYVVNNFSFIQMSVDTIRVSVNRGCVLFFGIEILARHHLVKLDLALDLRLEILRLRAKNECVTKRCLLLNHEVWISLRHLG